MFLPCVVIFCMAGIVMFAIKWISEVKLTFTFSSTT